MTVNMKDATMEVIESTGLFEVPIVVSGEANGPIQVTVEVAENGVGPAMENVHYIVTSKEINIPANTNTASVEIETIDDWDINDPRSFTVSIIDVKGAKIGTTPKTVISLLDEDDQPYSLMRGSWKFTGVDFSSGAEKSFILSMAAPKPGSNDYGKKLYAYGWENMSYVWLTFKFKFDEATRTATMTIPLGSNMSDPDDPIGFTFGDAYFKAISLVLQNGSAYYVTAGKVEGQVNLDMNEINFAPMDFIGAGVYATDGEFMGHYDMLYGMKFEKLQ
mgnify:FL=1